jgi:hypothetical protein
MKWIHNNGQLAWRLMWLGIVLALPTMLNVYVFHPPKESASVAFGTILSVISLALFVNAAIFGYKALKR